MHRTSLDTPKILQNVSIHLHTNPPRIDIVHYVLYVVLNIFQHTNRWTFFHPASIEMSCLFGSCRRKINRRPSFASPSGKSTSETDVFSIIKMSVAHNNAKFKIDSMKNIIASSVAGNYYESADWIRSVCVVCIISPFSGLFVRTEKYLYGVNWIRNNIGSCTSRLCRLKL
jgi:hypothetical protein